MIVGQLAKIKYTVPGYHEPIVGFNSTKINELKKGEIIVIIDEESIHYTKILSQIGVCYTFPAALKKC